MTGYLLALALFALAFTLIALSHWGQSLNHEDARTEERRSRARVLWELRNIETDRPHHVIDRGDR